MKKVWRFIRRWWWAFLMGLAAVVGAIAAILLRPKPDPEQVPGTVPPKTFKERAAEQVERVKLEGEIEKARVETRAEARNDELDEIEQIGENDPAEGRRRLASWLQNNL
jgi:hypothetical protein